MFTFFTVRKVFPGGSAAKAPVLSDTPLALIMAQLDAEAAAAEAAGGQEQEGQEEPRAE